MRFDELDGARRGARRRLLAVAAATLLAWPLASAAEPAETAAPVAGRFPSPDGRLVAVVARDDSRGGAEVAILTAAGQRLLRKDYASGQREERLDVVQARWTPDSAFFVISATSADGHQPWRFPVLFYSRAANAMRRLEDFSGGLSVVDPAFKVLAPDVVEVVGQKRLDRPSETRRFQLGRLRGGKRTR